MTMPADGAEDVAGTCVLWVIRYHSAVVGASCFDNALRGTRSKLKVQLSVINLGNTVALYNFLSTFSGTHFVTPRAIKVTVGVGF